MLSTISSCKYPFNLKCGHKIFCTVLSSFCVVAQLNYRVNKYFLPRHVQYVTDAPVDAYFRELMCGCYIFIELCKQLKVCINEKSLQSPLLPAAISISCCSLSIQTQCPQQLLLMNNWFNFFFSSRDACDECARWIFSDAYALTFMIEWNIDF